MFDWSKVEGYREDMSAEEKLALLENADTPAPDPAPNPTPTPDPKPADKPDDTAPSKPAAGTVSKAQYDKVTSELAKAKRDLRAKMTADEQAEADRAAAQEAMQAELDNLRREKQLSTYKASYLSLGYDEQLSEEAAAAMVEGDMDSVFAIAKKQSAIAEKALRAKILKETPVPPPDDGNDDAKKKMEENKLRANFGLPPKS